MGSNQSIETEVTTPKLFFGEFTEHPLLSAIENPINRFCDDFASSLVEESQPRNTKNDSPFGNSEMDDIDGFTCVRRLGDGAEAVVYEAIENVSGQHIALKRYKHVKHMGDGVPREVDIARALDHPRCIQILDCFQVPSNDFVVVMPYCKNGALSSSSKPEITIIGSLQLLYQVGSALQHLHSRNIVHRDVKPQNILLFEDGFTLCDFSVSVQLRSDEEMLSGVVGTSVFMAPEISNHLYHPKPVDMWALGITVYVLLFGKYPYGLEKVIEQTEATMNINMVRTVATIDLLFPEIPVVPNELKAIIAGLLNKNPEERLTAQQLCGIEWMISKVDEWNNMIDFITNGAV